MFFEGNLSLVNWTTNYLLLLIIRLWGIADIQDMVTVFLQRADYTGSVLLVLMQITCLISLKVSVFANVYSGPGGNDGGNLLLYYGVCMNVRLSWRFCVSWGLYILADQSYHDSNLLECSLREKQHFIQLHVWSDKGCITCIHDGRTAFVLCDYHNWQIDSESSSHWLLVGITV